MSARDRIFQRIRQRQGKPLEPQQDELDVVHAHIADHPRSPAPRDAWDPLVRFRERALALASTVDDAASLAEVPPLAAAYLRERELPTSAVCWPEFATLDWQRYGINVSARPAVGDDLLGITGAYCAIAETGTLVMLSAAQTPLSVSLLPETHIAILSADRIVRALEDVWALLRREHPTMPRAVNFISGPSRTADIEQTVTLGAHGPYRVHVVVVSAANLARQPVTISQ